MLKKLMCRHAGLPDMITRLHIASIQQKLLVHQHNAGIFKHYINVHTAAWRGPLQFYLMQSP